MQSLEQPFANGKGVSLETRKSCFLKVFLTVAQATSPETVKQLWKDNWCWKDVFSAAEDSLPGMDSKVISKLSCYFSTLSSIALGGLDCPAALLLHLQTELLDRFKCRANISQ